MFVMFPYYHISTSNGPLVIINKAKAKYKFRAAKLHIFQRSITIYNFRNIY